MRFSLLSTCASVMLLLTVRAVAQTTQDHSASPSHKAAATLATRQLALQEFTTLPKGILVLRLENFSTSDAARRAATTRSHFHHGR